MPTITVSFTLDSEKDDLRVERGYISPLCVDRLIKDGGFEEVFTDFWKSKKEEPCSKKK